MLVTYKTNTNDSCLKEKDNMRFNLPRTRREKHATKTVKYDPNCEKVVWHLGMTFSIIKMFRESVTKYAIQKKFQVKKYVNEPTRVRVKYCEENCK